MKIPFGILPGHWGVKGKTREIMKAEYELSGYDLEKKLLELNTEDEQVLLEKLLDLDLKYEKMTQKEYERQKADLLGEPFVDLVANYDPAKGSDGLSVELDWNDNFIFFLSENGYKGVTPESVVESWFQDICREISLSDGTSSLDNIMDFKTKREKFDETRMSYE